MDSNNFNDYLYIKYVKRKILIFNKFYLIILYLKKYLKLYILFYLK